MENLEYEVADITSVPEAVRGLYTQDGDVHRLNVAGLPRAEDTSGLKRALEAERATAKAAKQYQALDKTPDEIRELIQADEERKTKKLADEGDFKAILAQHQQKATESQKAIAAERDAANAALQSHVGSSAFIQELAKQGATEEGMKALPSLFASRISVSVQGSSANISIMQADGETPMAGNSENGTATLGDLVKDAASQYPSLFKSTVKAGGGMQPNNGGSTSQTGKSWTEAKTVKDKVDILKSRKP